MRGRPKKPTAWRRMEGNRGKRAWNHAEPQPPDGTPDCPEHLSEEGRAEWHRLVDTLVSMRVITIFDRAVLAAYCQAYGRWVEAEQKLKETPVLFKTPSGYVQQSPWLGIANRQMELMGRYMAEIGLTPASRSRIATINVPAANEPTRGVKLGNPNGAESLRRAGKGGAPLRAAVASNAAGFAADLGPVLADIRSAGHTSLRAIAAELTARGIRTRRGGKWGVGNVIGLLKRRTCP